MNISIRCLNKWKLLRLSGLSQKNILYEWLESDTEFTTTLERLKDVQKNDPFRTGTEEDTYVNAMMIALVVMETRERHYRAGNT